MIGQPEIVDGHVLATLNDWRAILYSAIGLVVALIGIIVALLRANRQERRDISAERVRMWAVADKFGSAASQLTGELQVQQALNARVESALTRVEDLQKRHDRRG